MILPVPVSGVTLNAAFGECFVLDVGARVKIQTAGLALVRDEHLLTLTYNKNSEINADVLMPTEFEISLQQGDDETIRFVLRDEQGKIIPSTEVTNVEFTAAQSWKFIPVITKTQSGGDITVNDFSRYEFTLSQAETSALEPTQYVARIRATLSSGSVETLGVGKLLVENVGFEVGL